MDNKTKYQLVLLDITRSTPVVADTAGTDDKIDAVLRAGEWVKELSSYGLKGVAYVFDNELEIVIYTKAEGNNIFA